MPEDPKGRHDQLPHITIRECSEEDIPKILEIENESFDDPYPRALFLAFLKQYKQGFRVAEYEGRLAGYCIISPWKNIQMMVISSLAIHPEFKRRKIATCLLNDAIGIAKSSFTTNRIVLQVAVDNLPAKELYAKFGFVESKLIKNYYGKNKDGIQMELVLKRNKSEC